MALPLDLLEAVNICPAGKTGWKRFEDVCGKLLIHLFVPPLTRPRLQSRTFLDIERRDAIFPNRNFDITTNWGKLHHELDARLVPVEFKNYDSEEIGPDEVNQTRNYLTGVMGRLALLCCNKDPVREAYLMRNKIYSEDHKVILFILKDHLREMVYIKMRGEDPSDLIMDLVEEFYLQQ
jgi:hypothetical protein